MIMSNTSPNPKPAEVKREEFRKYLEHAGVMDALTNILMSLYEERERPTDALEYIRKHFGVNEAAKLEISFEVDSLKRELSEAKSEINELKERLSKYESENAA